MPIAESIRQQLLSVPDPIVKSIEQVAKAAGDNDGATEESMAALKAAGRILAPHADSLTSAQVTQLMQAIGMLAQDPEDTAADADDAAEAEQDASLEADEAPLTKAADAEADDDDAAATASDEAPEADEEATDKAAPSWLKAKIKGQAKADADGDDDGDTADTDDDADGKKKAPFQKSADAGVSAPSQMGYASVAPRDGAPTPLESAVAKTAGLDLKGFTEAQRAALEPILKSQAMQAEATEQLRQAHKEAIAKSAALQHKLDRKEFVAKAAAFPHLGTAEELGERLHNLHIKDPDGYEAWVGILKSANAASDASPLFQERGSNLGQPAGGAADKITEAVMARVQKSATPMSYAQAENEFLKTPEGKKLYAEDRKEAEMARRRV